MKIKLNTEEPLKREKIIEVLNHFKVELDKYKVVVVAITDYFMNEESILKDSLFIISKDIFVHLNACVNQQHGSIDSPTIVEGAYLSFTFGERKTTHGKGMSHMKYVKTMLQDVDTIRMHIPGTENFRLGRDTRNKKYDHKMGIHRGNGYFDGWFQYCFFPAFRKYASQPNGFAGIHCDQFPMFQAIMEGELKRQHGTKYEKHVVPFVVISNNKVSTW